MFVLMYSASSCKSMADTSSAVGSTPAESKAFNWPDSAGKQRDLGWCRDSAGKQQRRQLMYSAWQPRRAAWKFPCRDFPKFIV